MSLVKLGRRPPAGSEREPAHGVGGMNWAAVLQESRGRREDLPPPPVFAEPARDLAERARRALYDVSDPEFPISLVDLGLITDIEADEADGSVTVYLTFTATACPCMDFIKWDVRERLLSEPDIRRVEIVTVWNPPWSNERITERGRRALARAGVAV